MTQASSPHDAHRTYVNPVYGNYFADPFVFHHEGQYYAIGTGPEESQGTLGNRIFPMLRSRDLSDWQPLGPALTRPPKQLGDNFWAPEIAYANGLFHLYYSVGHGDKRHQLRVATSSAPGGPYEDVGHALISPDTCAFAIDPPPFRDRDGRWYLFYARDFLDFDPESQGPRRIRPGTALVVQELVDMVHLGERSGVVLRASHDWQRFQANRPMYGELYDWHTLEGPSVLEREGKYYCLYSGGCWQTANYGVDYAVADDVLGPYSGSENCVQPRVLKAVPGQVLGPGHNSVVIGPDGRTPYIVYHAWDAQMTARRMCIDELLWTAEGPRSAGPTWTPQRLAL
ncbi:MAG TPA: glycoside hydrolase family 43 protein [Polyangiaceae bacterium]|nr:glycoside hydrolase family 43 protein [Polyangiaceae bacterium]